MTFRIVGFSFAAACLAATYYFAVAFPNHLRFQNDAACAQLQSQVLATLNEQERANQPKIQTHFSAKSNKCYAEVRVYNAGISFSTMIFDAAETRLLWSYACYFAGDQECYLDGYNPMTSTSSAQVDNIALSNQFQSLRTKYMTE